MKNEETILPFHPWAFYDEIIKGLGEDEDLGVDKDNLLFLQNLGFITNPTVPELTKIGLNYFEAKFIKTENKLALEILQNSLSNYPPTQAILQLLWGVKKPTRDNALSILKNRGFWHYEDQSPLTSLLLIMNESGLITYSKRDRTVKILANPTDSTKPLPSNVLIEPNKPYSNIVLLKRVLESCTGFIYWFDKHFQKDGLEIIWEIADANRMKEIKILSLDLGDQNLSKKSRNYYKRLKTELANKGINLTWYVIDSKMVKDVHDRWILGEKRGWNVPNINAILSGQSSEIIETGNVDELVSMFKNYLKKAEVII